MCLAIVTKYYTDSKGVRRPVRGHENPGPDWTEQDSGGPQDGSVGATLERPELVELDGFQPCMGWPVGSGLIRNILDGALLKSPEAERRVTPRTPGVVLTNRERDACRRLLSAAGRCGTRFLELRGYQDDGRTVSEMRMVIRARCGTRACSRCDKRIREKEAVRVEGDHRLFITLGVPQSVGSVATAHRKIGAWRESLFREFRRELARRTDGMIKLSPEMYGAAEEWNRTHAEDERARPAFQYAWCIEPHQSGYPHLHFLCNADWISYDWIRDLWSRIVGKRVVWFKGKKVYSKDGVCKYLAKYVSKTSFPADLCAIHYRRRLWASTLPPQEKPEPMWWHEKGKSQDELYKSVQNAEIEGIEEGWEVVSSKDEIYSIWKRAAPLPERVAVIPETSKCDISERLEGCQVEEHCDLIRDAIRLVKTLDQERENRAEVGTGPP